MTESDLTKILSSSKGRSNLAKAIAAPLAQRRSYSSLTRNIFQTQCHVCHQFFLVYEIQIVDINLKKCKELDLQGYAICKNCHKETVALINNLVPEDLPLYISDSNVFVREYAIKELKRS